jgi:hypothetical protein
MANGNNQSKLDELMSCGFEDTGRKYKIQMGENRGKEFPVFAQKGDIAALVYNNEKDKIELIYKLSMPYTGKPSRTSQLLKDLKKNGA